MQKPPHFFIVTICWNNLDNLRITLASLQTQSYQNWRCIVVDGKSSDGTQEFLYTLQDPRVEWLSEADTGIYNAMNKGAARIHADADYVLFLNSGDTLHNTNVLTMVAKKLEALSENIDRIPDLIFGNSKDINSSGGSRIRKAKPLWWRYIGTPAVQQAFFYSAKLANSFFYDERFKFAGDYEHLCRLIKQTPQIQTLYTNEIICDFYLGGASTSQKEAAMKEDIYIRENVLGMPKILSVIVHHYQKIRHLYKKLRHQA